MRRAEREVLECRQEESAAATRPMAACTGSCSEDEADDDVDRRGAAGRLRRRSRARVGSRADATLARRSRSASPVLATVDSETATSLAATPRRARPRPHSISRRLREPTAAKMPARRSSAGVWASAASANACCRRTTDSAVTPSSVSPANSSMSGAAPTRPPSAIPRR